MTSMLCACGGPEGPRTFPEGFNEPVSSSLTSCTDAGLLEGIDVSKYDATVDWNKVRDAGLFFGIARVSDGLNFPDGYFDSNWSNIKKAGMIRGAYQFFEPAQNPHAQAQYVLARIPDFGPGDLPPVIDVESTGGLDAGPAFASVKAWVDDIHAALGVRPIIYTSARVWNLYNNPTLDADLWVANWGVTCPAIPPTWADAGWTFWQYSATATVPGETAEGADVDRFNGSLAELQAYVAGPRGFMDGGTDGGGDAGSDGGVHDGGVNDGGASDAGQGDAGPLDGGIDAGAGDAGTDGGANDGGLDAGPSDGGSIDGGSGDAGTSDGGSSDAGSSDAGAADGGPGVSLTVANAGGQVAGIASLRATAAGASVIEIFLDGALFATSMTSPFNTTWDTRQSSDGTHKLQAKAYGASGDETVSSIDTVQVDNGTFSGCAAGFVLDGGNCEAVDSPVPSSGGCASAGDAWVLSLAAALAFSLRRKTALRARGKPC